MHKLVFASTFLIASFQGLLCAYLARSLHIAEHSMFQDDGELSTSPQRMGKQSCKRDPNYVDWSSVSNNMDVLREHLKERLFD